MSWTLFFAEKFHQSIMINAFLNSELIKHQPLFFFSLQKVHLSNDHLTLSIAGFQKIGLVEKMLPTPWSPRFGGSKGSRDQFGGWWGSTSVLPRAFSCLPSTLLLQREKAGKGPGFQWAFSVNASWWEMRTESQAERHHGDVPEGIRYAAMPGIGGLFYHRWIARKPGRTALK